MYVICGEISFNDEETDVDAVVQTTAEMQKRRPNALGLNIHGVNAVRLRHLKIIDISCQFRDQFEFFRVLGYNAFLKVAH